MTYYLTLRIYSDYVIHLGVSKCVNSCTMQSTLDTFQHSAVLIFWLSNGFCSFSFWQSGLVTKSPLAKCQWCPWPQPTAWQLGTAFLKWSCFSKPLHWQTHGHIKLSATRATHFLQDLCNALCRVIHRITKNRISKIHLKARKSRLLNVEMSCVLFIAHTIDKHGSWSKGSKLMLLLHSEVTKQAIH